MSRIDTPATGRMQTIARNPAVIALFMTLALAGCASKKNLPNSAGDLGLNGGAGGSATPGQVPAPGRSASAGQDLPSC